MIKYFLIPFVILGFLSSCSESELMTPGDEFLPPWQKEGAYAVEMNGTLLDFSHLTGGESSSSGSEVNGSNLSGGTITITLPGTLSVGTFTQAEGAAITISNSEGVFTNSDNSGPLSFVLNITQVTGSHKVTGTFEGMVFNPSSGLNMTLTNGIFNKINFEVVAGTTATFRATFNDQQIDFSEDAKAEGIVTAALISGKNPLQDQFLSIQVPGGIAVGTYDAADQVVYSVNMGGPADIYSNFDAVSNTFLPVSLKITSITGGENGRVKGTFEGTIAKFVNGVPTEQITVTVGEIDVPVAATTP